jgi:hypothetical protein
MNSHSPTPSDEANSLSADMAYPDSRPRKYTFYRTKDGDFFFKKDKKHSKDSSSDIKLSSSGEVGSTPEHTPRQLKKEVEELAKRIEALPDKEVIDDEPAATSSLWCICGC